MPHSESAPEPTDAEKSEKQRLWEEKLQQVDEVTDGLGMHIDSGIRETVAAMQLLGIKTAGSCEGHLQRGEAAPWVDIHIPRPSELSEKLSRLYDKSEQLEASLQGFEQGTSEFNRTNEELDRTYKALHETRRELDRLRAVELQRVSSYLERFYHNRSVPFDRRLVIERNGRITNQGNILLGAEDREFQARKLQEYQEEMGAFTEFLKGKVLEGS